MNKNKSVKVNLSHTFLIRTICRKCQTPPSIYYCLGNPPIWINPRKELQRFNNIKKYLHFRNNEGKGILPDPAMGISDFGSTPYFKSFNPKLHNSRGFNHNNNVTECLTCYCGRSIWWFSDRLNKNKPEITQKRFKINYPKSFKR